MSGSQRRQKQDEGLLSSWIPLATGLRSPPFQDGVVAVSVLQLPRVEESCSSFYHRKKHALLYQPSKALKQWASGDGNRTSELAVFSHESALRQW